MTTVASFKEFLTMIDNGQVFRVYLPDGEYTKVSVSWVNTKNQSFSIRVALPRHDLASRDVANFIGDAYGIDGKEAIFLIKTNTNYIYEIK